MLINRRKQGQNVCNSLMNISELFERFACTTEVNRNSQMLSVWTISELKPNFWEVAQKGTVAEDKSISLSQD